MKSNLHLRMLYREVFRLNPPRKTRKTWKNFIDSVLTRVLTPEEAKILRDITGIYGKNSNFKIVAKELGKTPEEVEFIYRTALTKLRAPKISTLLNALYYGETSEVSRIIEDEKREIIQTLCGFYWNWQENLAKCNKNANLTFSQDEKNAQKFYENNQRKDVIKSLSQLLFDWLANNPEMIGNDSVALASNLRPSALFAEFNDGTPALTDFQMNIIKGYMSAESKSVKALLDFLLSSEKQNYNFYVSNLTLENAESLIRAELSMPMFDFADLEETNFNSGYFPELLDEAKTNGMALEIGSF